MPVHFFNDFTLKMSTVVGLQASIKNKCMFLCQWFILPSRDFKVSIIAHTQLKNNIKKSKWNTLLTWDSAKITNWERNHRGNSIIRASEAPSGLCTILPCPSNCHPTIPKWNHWLVNPARPLKNDSAEHAVSEGFNKMGKRGKGQSQKV